MAKAVQWRGCLDRGIGQIWDTDSDFVTEVDEGVTSGRHESSLGTWVMGMHLLHWGPGSSGGNLGEKSVFGSVFFDSGMPVEHPREDIPVAAWFSVFFSSACAMREKQHPVRSCCLPFGLSAGFCPAPCPQAREKPAAQSAGGCRAGS